MKRTIQLTKKVANAELTGRKQKIVRTLLTLGAKKEPIEFDRLKKAARRVDPRSLRAHVRELRDMRLVSLRRAA